MQDLERLGAGVCLLLVCLLGQGCASTGAPEGYLPPGNDPLPDPYGAWIRIEWRQDLQQLDLAGEFLAVAADSLYVLAPGAGPGDSLRVVPLAAVEKARIAFFDPQMDRAGGYVSMGIILTVSHGWGLIISAPLWLLAGCTSAASHSRTPLASYPDRTWEELRKYARFPQGPPADLARLGLKGKPRRNVEESDLYPDRYRESDHIR